MKKLVVKGLLVSLSLVIFTVVTPNVEAKEWFVRTVEQVKKDITDTNEYTIQWGDTLSVISEAININLETLQELNNIQNRDVIIAGNKLSFTGNLLQVTTQTGEILSQKEVTIIDELVVTNSLPTQLESANDNDGNLDPKDDFDNDNDGNIDPKDDFDNDNDGNIDPDDEMSSNDYPLWEVYDAEWTYETEEEATKFALEAIERAKQAFGSEVEFHYTIFVSYDVQTQIESYGFVLY